MLPSLTQIRNLGIVAHIDSGKTTITERMLKVSGKIHAMGEVHDGEATMDHIKEERERGITIVSAATQFEWKDCQLNLIDTPGHVDFTAEVERCLRVLDGAVLAIDAVAGAQAQSETVNRQLNNYKVPRLVFVNKMDRVGADFERAVDSVEARLQLPAIPIQIPVGQGPEFRGLVDLVHMRQITFPESSDDPAVFRRGEVADELREDVAAARYTLLEKLSLYSDELLEMLLAEEDPPVALISAIVRDAVVHHGLVPVLLGSALRNRGIPALLDAVVDYLPSPLDKGAMPGVDPRSGEEIAHDPDSEAPLGAMVFKTVHFPTGDLTFLRVYSGTLKSGEALYNPRLGRHERIGRLYLVHAAAREAIEAAGAGHIVACLGLKQCVTGDTLCRKQTPISYSRATFASPVISMAIEPLSNADRSRLGEVLQIIRRDDPTFHVHTDRETGQTLISGMGELHLEVLVHRMRDEFRLRVVTGKPKVSYRQTLARPATVESRHIKQTGGSGQYAVAHVKFEPVDGEGLEFVGQIKGGKISQEYLAALERGIREYCLSGGRHGARIQGLRATVFDGEMHDEDSSQLAFQTCGVHAAQLAEERCGTIILEPIMRVVVTAPEEYLGSVLGDLKARGGVIVEIIDAGSERQITARVPLRRLPAYATTVRSITSGRGSYSMEPEGYEPVPNGVAETLEV